MTPANAILDPDGVTLRLDRPIPLPPGLVVVTVQPPPPGPGAGFLEVLEWIDRDRAARGVVPMTEEQMAAEIAATRAEDEAEEARWEAIWANVESPRGRDGS